MDSTVLDIIKNFGRPQATTTPTPPTGTPTPMPTTTPPPPSAFGTVTPMPTTLPNMPSPTPTPTATVPAMPVPPVGPSVPPQPGRGPNLGNIARGALDALSLGGPTSSTLATLFTKIPLGMGLYARMTDGEITAEDREAWVKATGSDITPETADQVLGELMRSFFGQGDQPGAGATAAPGGQFSGGSTYTGADGSTLSIPSQPSAGQYPGIDALNTGVVSGAPPTMPSSLSPGKLRGPNGEMVNALFQAGNPTPFAIWDDEKQRYHLAVDPSDANLEAAAKSGYFSQDYLMSLQTTKNGLLKTARDFAFEDANNVLSIEEKKLNIAVLQGQLSREKALEQYNIALAAANTRKAEIDAELGALELKLAPLAVKERQMALSKTQLELEQMRQSFPLDLEMKREQLAQSQFARQLQERQLRQSALDDQFMGQAYGQLMGVMTGGPPGIGGSAAGAPVTQGAPTPAAGPPNQLGVYGQLAQGAGVDPNDPAAQMAMALLQQQAYGRQGS